MLLAAVEAGGTKFVCGVGSAEAGSRETVRIDTTTPDETLSAVRAFFDGCAARHGPVEGLGIGTFGPVDLARGAATFGHITTTPKPGWAGVDILGRLAEAVGAPARIDTDVNAAARGELMLGAGQGAQSLAYVTVGTGVGVGFADADVPLDQTRNGEAGHWLLRRHPAHEGFAGVCPFHGDCLEGLASGPAIAAAWGWSLDALPADHIAWAVQADYLGQMCAAITLALSPGRIVLGGGVMAQARLLSAARQIAKERLAGYVAALDDEAAFEALIVAPGCREPPGLVGAYLLAAAAAHA